MSPIDTVAEPSNLAAAKTRTLRQTNTATGAVAPASPLRTATAPTHVLDRGEGRFWKLRPVTLADFVNPADYDYEIVRDYVPIPPNSNIVIAADDRMEVSGGLSGLVLTQVRDGYTVGRGQNFVLAPNNLWAVGVATVPPSTQRVGVYYMYLLEDSLNCRHSNSRHLGAIGTCTQIHFEYFDDADLASATKLPVVDTNVFALPHPLEGKLETDEGDGDEGRRR